MSSPSDTDSNPSAYQHRVHLLPQIGQNEYDQNMSGRQLPSIDPSLVGHNHTWIQREPLSHGASASSSTPLLRSGSSVQSDSTRYATAPFSMATMPAEARRQNLMAMDRKRRLTGSNQDSGSRRRNVAGGFNDRDDVIYSHTSDVASSSSRPPAQHQGHRSSPRPSTEVIDLTNSSPPPTTTDANLTRRSTGSMSGIYVVPRWQPDSEVTECPICRRQFTFLFRRHHCRKCGRVVCNDCSPHRITIPRQFIVNPPGPSIHFSSGIRDTVDLTGDEDDEEEDDDDNDDRHPARSGSLRYYRQAQNSAIGGGEKVRLCNPCVPDPQPEPQPNYASNVHSQPTGVPRRDELLTLSDALRGSRQDYHNNNSIETFSRFIPQHPSPYSYQHARTRPLPPPPLPLPLPPPFVQPRNEAAPEGSQLHSFPYVPNDRYRQRGPTFSENSPVIHQRHHSAGHQHTAPQPPSRPRIRSMLDESYIPRMLTGHPPPPRPRVNEEDICPICRRILPPKGPDGDESAREAHIIDCISARDPANQTGLNRASASSLSIPRGPMHMLPFMATEKDCVGDDGNTPECSICMVEYDVGDELARLECLCKFHRECISEWFTRKQECPVHKIS